MKTSGPFLCFREQEAKLPAHSQHDSLTQSNGFDTTPRDTMMDSRIFPGSKIARLPKPLQRPALVVRGWSDYFKRANDPRQYHHHMDGMATQHSAPFMNSLDFVSSYNRAVEASGWDYAIPWRIHQAIWAARSTQSVEGDIVEVGTGRGFVMSAVLKSLSDWSNMNKDLYLFDTFSPHVPDRTDGVQSSATPISPYYALSKESTESNFSEWPRVKVIEGKLPSSLSMTPIRRVSFLHVDLNHPAAEVSVLRALWPKVTRGGIVLLDDYCYKGHDEQCAAFQSIAKELRFEILATPTGQGIILKN